MYAMDEKERAVQVELAAKGDRDALPRLIVHYHVPLRRVLAGGMDGAVRRYIDPDDVLQETYIAAFKAVADCDFDGPGGFYKWLERIARNRLKNQQRALKQQKRDVGREVVRQTATTGSYPDLIQRVASPQSTPSRHMAREEATAAVMSCLARLTDDQRIAVTMRFLEARPVSEIAAHLGRSEMAVHMLFHRGLKALRKLMVSITDYLTRT